MQVETLLLAVHLAISLGDVTESIEPAAAVDARAESRVRPAGSSEPDSLASGELEVMAGATAGLRLSPLSLSIRYVPSVTFATYDALEDPMLFHQGMARALIDIGSELRLTAAHLMQYGERNFTAALVHDEADGRRISLEFLPDVERLPMSAAYTLAGLVWNPGRWHEYRLLGTYSSFGGRGERAMRRLPRQTGPRGFLEGDVGLSARNAVLLRARGSRTSFDPGPTFLIGEAEGGWRHEWDRRTTVQGLLGVFGGYNEEPVGTELRSVVLPTLRGELVRERGPREEDGLFELVFEAAPRINQLEATLDPRITIEGGMDWYWRDVEGRLDLGHAWVLDESLMLSGQILALGAAASMPLTRTLEIEGGGRLFRQRVRFGVDWWGDPGWYWDLYVALSFRADLLERRR